MPEIERFKKAASFNKKFAAPEALSLNSAKNEINTQRVEIENNIA